MSKDSTNENKPLIQTPMSKVMAKNEDEQSCGGTAKAVLMAVPTVACTTGGAVLGGKFSSWLACLSFFGGNPTAASAVAVGCVGLCIGAACTGCAACLCAEPSKTHANSKAPEFRITMAKNPARQPQDSAKTSEAEPAETLPGPSQKP